MVLVATGVILSLNVSNAQEPTSDPRSARILAMTKVYEPREYVSTSKVSLRYRMLKPMGYQPGKKYPLVLFLHGAGERGDDNQVTLVHAASDFADEQRRKQYPCYVVIPQCPEQKKWSEVDWSKDSS
jgi:predicted peptidase